MPKFERLVEDAVIGDSSGSSYRAVLSRGTKISCALNVNDGTVSCCSHKLDAWRPGAFCLQAQITCSSIHRHFSRGYTSWLRWGIQITLPFRIPPTTPNTTGRPTMAELKDVLDPKFAPFLGMGGIAFAMIFGCMGAAYGTAKSGIGIAGVGTFRSDLIMKSLIPVVMSGIIAVYALVVAVLIASDMKSPGAGNSYSLYQGCLHLACGLSVGLTGCAAGYAIGIVGDSVSLLSGWTSRNTMR
nr:v-type proton atpase 16 kda proteolipid subunit 2 [Quercus suber]